MSVTKPTGTGFVFWGQWVAANVVGELLGLGIVAAAGYATILAFGEPESVGQVLGFAAVAIGLGGLEGAIVGYAQFVVLRRRLPRMRVWSWVAATVAGAVMAWTLGMAPSSLASLHASNPEPSGSGPSSGISDALQLVLAIPMGLVAGAILGFPQWRVLRAFVSRAGWWVAANALAWACGMPLIFAVAGSASHGSPLSAALVIAAGLAGAGAIVGAVHGAFLVRLLGS